MKSLILNSTIAVLGAFLSATCVSAQVQDSNSSSAASSQTSQIKLRLGETLSSANAKEGQKVFFEVEYQVTVGGKVIIAAGERASGHVSAIRHKGHNHREGLLELTVDDVREVDGTSMHIYSSTIRKGSGKGEPIFGPCTFPLPADPVGLFRKGQDVLLPAGTEVIAVVKI